MENIALTILVVALLIGGAGLITHLLTRNGWQIVELSGTQVSVTTGRTMPHGSWAARRRQGNGWEYREATPDEAEHALDMWAIR